MRISLGSFALIRCESASGTTFLLQWNEKWGALNFVGGHREKDESFRECVSREITEELGLRVGEDVRVAPDPLAQLRYTARSRSADEERAYTIEVFVVELESTDRVRAALALSHNRWVDVASVVAGQCRDGTRVSVTVGLVLERLGLLTAPTPRERNHDHRSKDDDCRAE